MTTIVTAHFDGTAFIPDEPVELPAGSKVAVQFLSADNAKERPVTGLAKLASILKSLPADPDAPSDGAAQHDHYLYGTPKR